MPAHFFMHPDVMKGDGKMLFVCKNHVVKGLQATIIPHIGKLSEHRRCTCKFCKGKAQYKLFHLW
ncbi:hypothetical protein SAMN05192534_10354 [Alteribacillus persepolensis]|uniref:Uncharacterized protein n=1 Tax=Alteribacillus persepolensis TaxID=568899 RepID=A0A1G8AXB6_9BACI|nr:hypothetical protein SAMN05192534_10354 [Alteribacillus persepolensis]